MTEKKMTRGLPQSSHVGTSALCWPRGLKLVNESNSFHPWSDAALRDKERKRNKKEKSSL